MSKNLVTQQARDQWTGPGDRKVSILLDQSFSDVGMDTSDGASLPGVEEDEDVEVGRDVLNYSMETHVPSPRAVYINWTGDDDTDDKGGQNKDDLETAEKVPDRTQQPPVADCASVPGDERKSVFSSLLAKGLRRK